MSDALTPRQVAAQLGVSTRTVQRWIASGRLPATRVGGRGRVSRSSLTGLVAGGTSVEVTRAPVRRLLVANRGEIAERVARTARRLGVHVIAVHEPGDRAPADADERHQVGSYLDPDEILAVGARTGADSVHPGYGFLAENADFAAAVERAGLTWVGPPSTAIAAVGDKAAARRVASAHDVPVVPGYDGDAQDDATLVGEAERIGYPLLVKPAAGGGGKGMRVVRGRAELAEMLAGARREARRAFGDDRLILERFLDGARHVEVQVMFDRHGRGVHLGERDCSTQRRNQKIVEEAPAPHVTPQLRERLGRAAVAIAGAVGYASAGTVEMLLTDAGDFFMLEVNARLQVEHPVTEAVIGRDLVEDQLRIAGGATLSELGLDVPPVPHGHAIEARLYAEDPEAGFLPATGRLALLRWPPGIRVDTGVRQGDRVGDRYDPLLAKLIVHGATRDQALDRLRAALAATTVLGVRTNLRFLRWLAERTPMRDGRMRTDTIAGLDLPAAPRPGEATWRAAAQALAAGEGQAGPWHGGWRLNAPSVLRLRHEGEDRSIRLTAPGDAQDPDPPLAVRDGDVVHVEVDGASLEFGLAPPPSVEEAVRHASAAGGGGASAMLAPMPGRVIAVRAQQGATVRAQQVVVIIEAMKMEHAVLAPADGVLTSLHVREGQQVQRGDLVGEVGSAN